MYKKIFLFFLSVLLLLTGCTAGRIPSEKTSTEQNQEQPDPSDTTQETIVSDTEKTTSAAITVPDGEENEEATENPEETLNDILNRLHELEELMNGT